MYIAHTHHLTRQCNSKTSYMLKCSEYKTVCACKKVVHFLCYRNYGFKRGALEQEECALGWKLKINFNRFLVDIFLLLSSLTRIVNDAWRQLTRVFCLVCLSNIYIQWLDGCGVKSIYF